VGRAAPAAVLVSELGEPGGERGGSGDGGDGDASPAAWTSEQVGSEPAELLELAHRLVVFDGTILFEKLHFGPFKKGGDGLGVSSKSTPTDLVSDADREAEQRIRERIESERPEDGFLGEESGERQGSSGLRWVVDPLDGTINYLFGIPQWSVSVAVQDERGSLAGAIYDPVRKECFAAQRGGEATLSAPPKESVARPGVRERKGDRTLVSSGREDLATAMVATGFAYDARVRAAQAKVLTRVLPEVRDIRRFGSAALDLAWTAAGRFDAYYERGVKLWDIAAGTLICEATGLQVHELPEQGDLPWGILVAPPALCEPLLELVG
jgi:myo-inositol-1(or 4)-monophosphatase